MSESGDVLDGMSFVRDNAFVNYDIATMKSIPAVMQALTTSTVILPVFKLVISVLLT